MNGAPPPLLQMPRATEPVGAGSRPLDDVLNGGVSRGRLPLIDAQEMATILGISRDALYDAVRNGQVSTGCYRVGGRWRFDPEEVLDSLRANRGPGPDGMGV